MTQLELIKRRAAALDRVVAAARRFVLVGSATALFGAAESMRSPEWAELCDAVRAAEVAP